MQHRLHQIDLSHFAKDSVSNRYLSTPYSTHQNGQAEVVSILKNGLKAVRNNQEPMQYKLDKILMKYRITPYTTTGETPSKLMFGRTIRSRLDMLKPSMTQRKNDYELRLFEEGETILARDYRSPSQKWQIAIITNRNGPVIYDIKTTEGGNWRRHANQLLHTGSQMGTAPNLDIESDHEECQDNNRNPSMNINNQPETVSSEQHSPLTERCQLGEGQLAARKSRRERKPPERYGVPITDFKTWK